MKKRASAASLRTLLWLFTLGSLAGFIFEGIYALLKRGVWENHSATVWGPFCIIYGIGAVAVYLVCILLDGRSMVEQFLLFALAGSAVEYIGSYVQEEVFGSTSWDYSGRFLNLGGRICFSMSMIWGALGLGFARLIFPTVLKIAETDKSGMWRAYSAIIAIFMLLNLMISAAAVLRWRSRRLGIPAQNDFETYIDRRYGEEYMERVYGNMEFKDGEKE